MTAVRPRLSREDVRVMQERRRSAATRFSRTQPRRASKRQAITESRQS